MTLSSSFLLSYETLTFLLILTNVICNVSPDPEPLVKASPGLRRERTVAGVMARPPGHKAPTRSTPGSPVRECHPLHWFVRDIDIGDGPPSDTRSDTGGLMSRSVSSVSRPRRPHYMMPLQRTRSRHDCNFIPGTPFLNTGKVCICASLSSKYILWHEMRPHK